MYIFCGTGERNQGYALLMTANKPETALYRAPTFSLLLVSHGGLVHDWTVKYERDRECFCMWHIVGGCFSAYFCFGGYSLLQLFLFVCFLFVLLFFVVVFPEHSNQSLWQYKYIYRECCCLWWLNLEMFLKIEQIHHKSIMLECQFIVLVVYLVF